MFCNQKKDERRVPWESEYICKIDSINIFMVETKTIIFRTLTSITSITIFFIDRITTKTFWYSGRYRLKKKKYRKKKNSFGVKHNKSMSTTFNKVDVKKRKKNKEKKFCFFTCFTPCCFSTRFEIYFCFTFQKKKKKKFFH